MPDPIGMLSVVAGAPMILAGTARWVEGFVMRAILVYGGITVCIIGTSSPPILQFAFLVFATGTVLLFAFPDPRFNHNQDWRRRGDVVPSPNLLRDRREG